VPGSEGVFSGIDDKQVLSSSAVYAKGRKVLTKSWVLPAVNSPRVHFDNYLFESVITHTNTRVYRGIRITDIERFNGHFVLNDQSGKEVIQAESVIIAVGANANLREQVLGRRVVTGNYGVAVSQYFEGVDISEDQNHLFVPYRQKIPGYFWIFPLGQNQFNVGYGLLSKKKVSVSKMFEDILHVDPHIAKHFNEAKALGKIRGHKLPFPSFSWPLTSDGALIIGDAAELMDPLLGHGIDKAMLSGIIAVETLIDAFAQGDLSKESLGVYEERIEKEVYPEIKSNARLLRILYPIMRFVNLF